MALINKSLTLALASLVAMPLLAPSLASAQDDVGAEASDRADYDPAARAAEHYAQAAEAYGAGDFERAADLLRRAFANEPNLIYKYNEILALMGLGDYDQALVLLDTYGEPMAADGRFSDLDELHEELHKAQAAAQAQTPDPRGDTDEETRRETAPGIEQAEASIAERDRDQGPNGLAWSLVGGGAALLAGGAAVASGLLIPGEMERLQEWTALDYEGSAYDHGDDRQTLRNHQIVSVLLLSTGLVATATGATFLVLHRGHSAPTAPTPLSLSPLINAQGFGASLEGRF